MEDVLANKILDAVIEIKQKINEMDVNIKDLQNGQKSLKYEIVVLQDDLKDFKRSTNIKLESLESEVGSMKDALLDVARTVKSHDSDIKYLKAKVS